MATPIKAVPILTGALAEDFVRQAEENERKPRRILSEEQEKKIEEIMRRSREAVPSWLKQWAKEWLFSRGFDRNALKKAGRGGEMRAEGFFFGGDGDFL